MKILVTGGNGFLGSRIAKALVEEGHDVVSLQRSDPAVIIKQDDITYIQGDLTDKSSILDYFKGVDAVFHVAALAGFWGPWDEYYLANVKGTDNLIDACRVHEVKYLIYTSTPSVVFTGESICGLNEEAGYGRNWLCHYAQTKRIAEEKILSPEVTANIHTVALRPHLIWGDGDPHLLPRLVARARDQKLKIVGDGNNRVDATHVDNATYGHLKALEALLDCPDKISGKAYFLSDGNPVKMWEWLNAIFDKMHVPRVEKKLPFKLVYRIGHFFELCYRWFHLEGEPAMTRFIATELAEDHYFDICAAKRDLGYEPVVDQQQAMNDLIRYLNKI